MPSGDQSHAPLTPDQEQEIRSQLRRILSSSSFSKAPALSSLLRHIVECTLGGELERLKEYCVGVEALGRKPSFDPGVDTIVRTQARRLRAKLSRYYADIGAGDPIAIEIPKGSYLARFAVHRESRVHPAEGTVENRYGWLPAPLTSFVGRAREVRALTRLLDSKDARLITITGPGGSGKTRLAIEVAQRLRDRFSRLVFVSLAPVGSASLVALAMAQALGLTRTDGLPLEEALVRSLHDRLDGETLLIADNFEHVSGAGVLLARMLEAKAGLKVLTTSRESLHLYGEQEFPLEPLPMPDCSQEEDSEAWGDNPSVLLFMERAAGPSPSFRLTPEALYLVARICERLDGLPLAIELAAAHCKALELPALLRKLERPLDLLAVGPRNLPKRQRGLRDTIDWSHALLADSERALFRRLSVFPGGCSLEGAEAVGNTGQDIQDVPGGLASLVDKSMLQTHRSGDGELRYAMLETVREYGLEKLKRSGETRASNRALAAYCLVIAEEGNQPMDVASREAWLACCDRERDNFGAAFDALLQDPRADWACRLGAALYQYWERRERLLEAKSRLSSVLEAPDPDILSPHRAAAFSYYGAVLNRLGDYVSAENQFRKALRIYSALKEDKAIAGELNSLAIQLFMQGRLREAREAGERCVRMCREIGRPRQLAGALNNLGKIVRGLGILAEARVSLLEALDIVRGLGDERSEAWTLNHLGDFAREEGRLLEAQSLYEQGLAVFRKIQDPWGIARSLVDLGDMANERGNEEEARAFFACAIQKFAAAGYEPGVAQALSRLAHAAAKTGCHRLALRLGGAAEALRKRLATPATPAETANLDRVLAASWAAFDHSAANAAWESGRSLDTNAAIKLALQPPAAGG